MLPNRRITLTSERFRVWHNLTGMKELQLKKGALTIIVENVEDGISLDYFELIPVN